MTCARPLTAAWTILSHHATGFAARSLATAGEPVLARLPESLAGLSDAVAEAAVQTAWLINGPEALDVMARYAADRRRIVQSELSRAWEYFDPEEYAERVLSAMPPGGHIYVPSSAQLAALGNASPAAELEINLTGTTDLTPIVAHAVSLRGLSLYYDEPGADPAALPALPKLDSLALGLPGLADLHFLDALPQLEMIWLTNCWDIEDYSPLLRFTRLRTLTMFSSHQLRSLVQLPPLEAVRTLSLDRSGLGRGALEGLVSAAPHITNLYLGSCAWLDDLRPLAGLKLGDLRIHGSSAVSDLRPLSGQTNLSFLDVSQTRINDLTPLEGLSNLRIQRLTGCDSVSDLRPVACLSNLRELRIEGITAGTDLSPLAGNPKVTVYIAARQEVHGGEKLGTSSDGQLSFELVSHNQGRRSRTDLDGRRDRGDRYVVQATPSMIDGSGYWQSATDTPRSTTSAFGKGYPAYSTRRPERRFSDALASRRRPQNVAVMSNGSTRWTAEYAPVGRCRLPSLRTASCAPSLQTQGHVDELRRLGMQGPVPDQFNLVVTDMDATVAFYRKLGLTIPDTDPQWQRHHRTAALPGGVDLDLDSGEFARHWNHGWRGGMGVLGFKVDSRERVDELYADLAAAGYRGQQPPYDAFWGARYAVIEDPDGNAVGIMSPVDPDRRSQPDFGET